MSPLSMIGHVQDTSRVMNRAFNERFDYGKDILEVFKKNDFKKIYFLGSGTSHHVAKAIRDVFVKILKIEGDANIPNIFTYHEIINPNSVYKAEEICVIGFSQHGTSISTCEALTRAKDEGYFTIGVTETLGSPITRIADLTQHLVCEEEEIGPETRGYTATIFQFYILAIEIALAKGIITKEQHHTLNHDALNLLSDFDIVVSESIDWYNLNKDELLEMTKCSIAGYGNNYPTALEGRLKLFETFARPCTAYEQEEQMHGPMRAYGPNNYIFLIGGSGPEISRLNELTKYYKKAFTKHVFVITYEDEVTTSTKDLKLSVKTSSILSPIFYVVPFQVLSALLCEDVGIDTTVSPVKDRSVSSHMEREWKNRSN